MRIKWNQATRIATGLSLVGTLAAGCGGHGTSSGAPSSTEPKVVAKMAIFTGATSPQTLAAKRLASLVKQYTDGRVTINVYPNGELGSAAAVLQDLENNTVQMAVTVANIDALVPQSDVILAPYMFPTASVAMKVLQSPVMQKVWNQFGAHHMKVIGVWQFGYADLLTTRKVDSLASLSGMRVRVMDPVVGDRVMRAFGANPTPMALNQAFTALETHTLDGMEDPPATLYTGKYYQAAHYLALTKEIFVAAPVLVSSGFWRQLSPAEQQALLKAEKQVLPYEEQEAKQQETADIAAMVKSGVVVTKPNLTPFQQRARVVRQQLSSLLGPIVGEVQKAVAQAEKS